MEEKSTNIRLEEFISRAQYNNAWVDTDYFHVYVRRAFRKVPIELMDRNFNRAGLPLARTFEMANISVRAHVPKGQGHLKAWLPNLIKTLRDLDEHFDGLYIENVQEPRLQKFLMLRGFVTIHSDPYGQRSMFFPLKSEI